MTLLQEVQSLILEQSEDNLKAIAVILRAMTPNHEPDNKGSIIGALKDKYVLPPDYLEQSEKLDKEIAEEFNGE